MLKKAKSLYQKIRFALKVNWYKTLLFNFKKFPFSTAKKLPVFFYGRVKFKSISGQVDIKPPIKRGMVQFGLSYEMNTKRLNIAEIALYGKIVFKGYAQFGKDNFLFVGKEATCEFDDMVGIASKSQVICTDHIHFDHYARMGNNCKVVDTDFHQMINSETGEKHPMTKPIKIGQFNYIGSHVTLAKGTVTPDYCTVATHSLCTKDYSDWGENTLIGGIPAKKLKENIARDWKGEAAMMNGLILH